MDFVSRRIGNAYLTPEVQLLLRVGYRVRLGIGPLDQLRLGAARKRGLHDVVFHWVRGEWVWGLESTAATARGIFATAACIA